MSRRRKFDNPNQLALDFNATEAVTDARQRIKLIPNEIVTHDRDAGREDVFRFFEKWEIPLQNQGRMMGFWRLGPYEDWVDSMRPIASEQAERISVIIQIDEYLQQVFGSHEEAMAWLNEPNHHFDKKSPLEYMSTNRTKVLIVVSMRLFLMKMNVKR